MGRAAGLHGATACRPASIGAEVQSRAVVPLASTGSGIIARHSRSGEWDKGNFTLYHAVSAARHHIRQCTETQNPMV